MIRTIILALILIEAHETISQEKIKTARENQSSKNIKLINGNWFNGETFESKTVWVSKGVFSFKNENKVNDTIIDLTGKYVIPPFAEAHNHNLESSYKLDGRIDSYLKNGVFYVKLLSSIKKRIDPLMHLYNKPNGLDVSLAHAPLTATGGHPVALRLRFLEYGRFNGLFNNLEEIESNGFWIINDLAALNNKWDKILSFKPDFIKIMLLYSEEYELRKNDTTYFGNKGLNPGLVPEIVERAHKNNLSVSAHVETAYDFHVAVKAGVDEIAHLPEIDNGKLIDLKDVKAAKEKGIFVVTTVSLITKEHKKAKSNYNELLANIQKNLKLLRAEGVKLAIGSDMYNDNSVDEFQLLHSFEVFSNLELLKMWCENSAVTTFPNRKIGSLEEGYEASFLVLDSNPLNNMNEINKSIILRVKQGVVLNY